jgi:UPF0755 protein
MKKYLFLIIFLVISILIIFLYQGIYLPENASSKSEVVFSIKKGEGTKEIAVNLEKQRLIKMATLFRIYTLFKGNSGKLQAGDYFLSSSMTIPEMAAKFASGDVIKENITIIEGWNLRDIGSYFENQGISPSEELFKLTGSPLGDYSKDFFREFDFLKDKPKNVSLEGYLFPDTYEINRGISLEEIIRKILQNFDKKLTLDLRQEITAQKKSIFEIVNMASLIEKEVRTFEDKKIVSGILWKRLENNIPLQVDATISYITGKKASNISIEETKIDSPYNTYKYKGLPLGPICNPSLESIMAALYPESSNYWYYLSTPEGETIFSKILEEHNIAKEKYLK